MAREVKNMKKTLKVFLILVIALIVTFFAVNTIRFIGINNDNIARIQNDAYIPEEVKSDYLWQTKVNNQWGRLLEYNQIYCNVINQYGETDWSPRKAPLSFYMVPTIIVVSGFALIEVGLYLKHNKKTLS